VAQLTNDAHAKFISQKQIDGAFVLDIVCKFWELFAINLHFKKLRRSLLRETKGMRGSHINSTKTDDIQSMELIVCYVWSLNYLLLKSFMVTAPHRNCPCVPMSN